MRNRKLIKRLAVLLIALTMLLPYGTALAVTYYRVNTSWLAAYSEPKDGAARVASYPRDSAITIENKGKVWSRVRFRPGGAQVYVHTKYLTACSSYSAQVSQDGTTLLAGPSASYKSLGTLDKGSKVTVLTHGSSFSFVSSTKGKGYIRNTHLTTQKISGKTAYIKNPRNRRVNLRSGPGKKYKVLAEYRPGTKVTLLKYGKAWCKVSVGGRTGYIMTKYLRRN